MPSRKQRRRREKGRRHEWEYVYVDDDGREVEIDPDAAPEPAAKPAARAKRTAPDERAKDRGKGRPRGRAARAIEPPSFRRVARRALFVAPLMYLVITFTSDLTPAQRVTQTLVLLALFLPFSYLMDSIAYRAYRRRTARAAEGER